MDKTSYQTTSKRIKGKEYGYLGKTLEITVTYGFHQIGDQEPYFSITGDISRLTGRDKNATCGCIHKDIIEHFPNLEPLIKWHLTDQSGLPVHYMDNTLYHFQIGKIDSARVSSVWGEVETDGSIREYSQASLQLYLADRLPKLKASFNFCMDTFGVERIKE